ncbi:MAG TPA: hypothetical protein VEW74_03930, partial [Candidatus Nitrosotalea sp.]|nr:hypothetical protein [Candidatus Nitrosotalea sp.]
RNPISSVFAALLMVSTASGIAAAYEPSVAQLDAQARAAGNRRDVADRIGVTVFATRWPAEVSQISANALGDHLIIGVRVLGVKFHRPITRSEFESEIAALVAAVWKAAPEAEEIDLWASVPIAVAKGAIVSGDLAKPVSRTVFSLTVRRGESTDALRARINGAADGVFWDPQWTRTAFKDEPNV